MKRETTLFGIVAMVMAAGFFSHISSNTDKMQVVANIKMHDSLSIPKVNFEIPAVNDSKEHTPQAVKTVPAWGEMKAQNSNDKTTIVAKKADAKKVAKNDKKKKDKKKKEVAKTDTKSMQKAVANLNDENGRQSAPLAYATTTTQVNKEEVNDGKPHTLADWEAYLLGAPNFERTLEFIAQYQLEKIPGEWFYSITNKMTSSGAVKMQELGVYALGSVVEQPAFEQLSVVYVKHQLKDLSGQRAALYINNYAHAKFLSVLTNVLQGKVSEARVQAVYMIKHAAELNGRNGDTGRGRGLAASMNTSAQFLTAMKIVAMYQQDEDVNVRNACISVYQFLHTLLA